MSLNNKQLRKNQAGLTLVELVISIVIISIAMTALLSVFSSQISASADPLNRNKALKLAQYYMDEILSKNYDDTTPIGGLPVVASPSCAALGPDGAEVRATFDDVDDYDGTVDSPPRDIDGAVLLGYDGYRVEISVSCDTAGVVDASTNNEAKKVELVITAPGRSNAPYLFSVYKGNY